jgi:ABC-type nitrate/sulfonate/bicarbonate transport system substrate-binding protein
MSRIVAFALAAALTALAQAAAAEKLVLQLHGPAQFEFAGYYAALWNGYYSEAGLDVEVRRGAERGQPPIDPAHELIEGRAQFGTGGAELIIRAAQGQPLLLLAPIFQQSGAAIYYRGDSDFSSPAVLAAARIGRTPASDILDAELTTALRAEGIDPDKLKSMPIAPGDIAAALADRRVDAAIGSAWELPWLAREKGLTLKSLNPADYRVEFYGDTLFTLRRYAQTESERVRRFRAASLRGWDYALQYPDEVAARMVAELPRPAGISDPAGFDRYQADVARRLARYPEIPLGHSNYERWSRIEASLVGAGVLMRSADPSAFVYDPDAQARDRNDFRALTILGGTLLMGLAAIGVLWAVRRRRPGAASAAGGAEAETEAAQSEGEPIMQLAGTPAPVDLNSMLTRIERAIRERVPRRIDFRLSLLPELWRCHTDLDALRPVVLALVSGAVAELKTGGALIVGTRNLTVDAATAAEIPGTSAGEFARLTVRDNGPGFSEETLARILDPAATARPSAASAAEAVRGLGGFVRVESAEGVGTAVHIYFARVAEEQRAEPGNPAAAPGNTAAAAE